MLRQGCNFDIVGAAIFFAQPLLGKNTVFAGNTEGIRSYRITGIVVTTKGTVLAYCEARKNNSSDRGEIEVHLHRSIDGGKTWKGPEKFATGDGWAENIKTNKLALRNNQTNLFLNLCFKE